MPRPLLLMVLFAGGAVAADVVILPDGFTLQGKHDKEKELVAAGGGPGLAVAKANGFDLMQDGPRVVTFSRHMVKGGKLEQAGTRPEYIALRQPRAGGKAMYKNIGVVDAKFSPFDAKWVQTITGKTPKSPDAPGGAPAKIIRQVSKLDPYTLEIDGITHAWQPRFQTSEYPPDVVRGLLANHPTLKEPAGKPDPAKRLQIATFLKDVSLNDPSANGFAYLQAAKDELEKLTADTPGGLQGNAAAADKLREELAIAETRRMGDELEAAITAGRWQFARAAVATFTPSAADPKESLRYAGLKTTIETTTQRFEQTARLLDEVLAGVAGPPARAAVVGGAGGAIPLVSQSATLRTLAVAAAAVRAELHPDTAGRLELFVGQADAKRRFGGANNTKPEALLALAVSGALKGKNGADPDPAAAVAAWEAREFVGRYLRGDNINARIAALDDYRRGTPAGADELTQVVSVSPPPEPLDPAMPGRPLLPAEAEGARGLFDRRTPTAPEAANGVGYVLRLPAEWHPGRSYPVLLALTTPAVSPAAFAGRLQEFADRHGYIVAAPYWAARGEREYDYRGLSHPAATLVLRDVFRRVRCDADRVFAYGYGAGADFALDFGLAHPDLLAGVVLNGAQPPEWLTAGYWRNAQKLPLYFVCGELGPEYGRVKPLFEKWMPFGFPALMTVFRGRPSPDFFAVELPRIFDWMGRKTRVRGTASLKLGPGGVEPWQVLREADDRFYWVGVGQGGLKRQNMLVGAQPGQPVEPARFKADIGRNGQVEISGAVGVRKFVIWLERELIDWAKPLAVSVNGRPPLGYKPQVLKPDIGVMLEELYRSGDTKMLFLGKVEVNGPG